MRCFIALPLPESFRAELARIQDALRPLVRGTFPPPGNFHLTLKFLGEIDERTAAEVRVQLRAIAAEPLGITLGGLGVFTERAPRVVWAALEGDGVHALHRTIDERLSSLFPRERRFTSHVTLARIRDVKDPAALLRSLAAIRVTPLRGRAPAFSLLQSRVRPGGSAYTELERYPLSPVQPS